MDKPLLRIVDIHKSFGDLTVLSGVNAEINAGEVVAIQGASGTGKSTLLNIIGLLDKPDSGSVHLDGTCLTNIKSVDELSLVRGREIGFIFQAYHLLPEFNVIENILMPIRCQGKPNKVHEQAALELLEQVSLKNRAYEMPNVLSGGERQRIAVCRALIHKPKLILADEPTGNLDPDTTQVVLGQLLGLAREQNTSVLMVSHDPLVCQQSDRLLSLKQHSLSP